LTVLDLSQIKGLRLAKTLKVEKDVSVVVRSDPASVIAPARYPAVADFHVGALDGGPCDPGGGFFLTRVSNVGLEGVIESGPVDVLGVRRKVTRDRIRQVLVGAIGHWLSLCQNFFLIPASFKIRLQNDATALPSVGVNDFSVFALRQTS
jgi:hypothetical protein